MGLTKPETNPTAPVSDVLIQGTGMGTDRQDYKYQNHHLLAVWPRASYSMLSASAYQVEKRDNSIHLNRCLS